MVTIQKRGFLVKVTPGSVAASGLTPGDVVLKIGNVTSTNINHVEAQDVIRGASNILQLTIRKGSVTSAPVSPSQAADPYSYSTPTSPPTTPSRAYPPNYSQPPDRYQTQPDQSGYGQQGYQQGTPPMSGYSTLPVRGSANKQNNESFRPVQPKFKSTSGIQLQFNRDQQQQDQQQNDSYDKPMSPLSIGREQDTQDSSPYQRQTSLGSNRMDNGYQQPSHFRKPTPYQPQEYVQQNGSAQTPQGLQRQTSQGGTVYDSTITQGFSPPGCIPRSDDAPPPPPPPTNYQGPDPYQYQSPAPFQRQTSQGGGYRPQPNNYDQRQDAYSQQRQPPPPAMYGDSYQDQQQPQYGRPQQNVYDPRTQQQQQPRPEAQSPQFQRQQSLGSQSPAQQQQQYGSPYTSSPAYNRQQSAGGSPYQGQNQYQPPRPAFSSPQQQQSAPPPPPPPPPPAPASSGSGITSFEDILSPFESFQNSNYCDKLFERSPEYRGEADSGVMSDYQSPSLPSSDTPRSNQSSSYGYSPPVGHPQYDRQRSSEDQGMYQRSAPPHVPPPPPAGPPPPPPPPPPPMPPTSWAPPKRTTDPRQQQQEDGESGAMPDKVLNSMLKNKGAQKPFSYIPSAIDLKKFKEKSRQRNASPHQQVMPRGYKGPQIDRDEVESEAQKEHESRQQRRPPGAAPDPATGVYKHAQFNSPLRIYSKDNAADELRMQSGGNVDVTPGDENRAGNINNYNNNVSNNNNNNANNNYNNNVNHSPFVLPRKTVRTPEKQSADIKESEVYKMIKQADAKGKGDNSSPVREPVEQELPESLPPVAPGSSAGRQGLSFKVLQWMTDTMTNEEDSLGEEESYKPKKPRDPLLRHNSEDDEMRFSGLHTKADIPSKAFQLLNKIAAADDGQSSPNSQQQEDDEPEERVGNYDEASIRYRGKNIPSPSFRVLQSWTKSDQEANSKAQTPVDEEEEDDGLPDKLTDEDMTDKRYMGGSIPSRAFRALQLSMGDKDETASSGAKDSQGEEEAGPRAIKVISRTRAQAPKVKQHHHHPEAHGVPAPRHPVHVTENPSTDF